jgi:monoamine oxidase
MDTTANLVQHSSGFAGRPMLERRVANDTRGHLAALLNDAVARGVFDGELTPGERKSLLDLLKVFGDLHEGHYLGSTRSGCAKPETVSQACEPMPPLGLTELLDSQFWTTGFYQPVSYLWQPTMFQPVGGMDKIVEGFLRQVGGVVVLGAEVQRIAVSDTQVSVAGSYDGRPFTASAEFCVSSIPFSVLRSIPTNLAAEFADAVATPDFEATCKVGWQAQSRFWESDAYQIYGGISRTNDMITQMWYPSNDYFTAKGTLTGAYNYNADAVALGELPFPDRLVAAKRGGAKLHPEIADESIVPTALGVSIAWHKVPHQLGGWANWKHDDPTHQVAYRRLLAPDRRFYVTGDQISPLPGWQEGAIMSAEYVCGQIGGQLSNAEPDEVVVPDAKTLTQGD